MDGSRADPDLPVLDDVRGARWFRTLFGRAPIGIALVRTRTRRILDVNEAYARIVGRTVEEVLGADWATFTHPDDLDVSIADSDRFTGERALASEAVTKRLLRPDGSVVTVSLQSAAVDTGDGDLLHLAMLEDITDRVGDAERLADSERRYRLLADHAGDVVMLFADGVIEWIAPSIRTMLGYEPADLVGTATLDLIHPDDRDEVYRQRLRALAGVPVRVRARFRHVDGRWLWIEYSVRAPEDGSGDAGAVVVSTMWNVHAEVEAREALRQAEAERAEMEASMHRAARLESLGVLAGGVAHDFNNILVGILGNVELAMQQLPPDSSVRHLLHGVATGATRASDLTRQLLDYAGHRPFDRAMQVDPLRVVRDTLELVAPLLPRGAFLETDLSAELPAIGCDRGQLQQVVMNLVVNAADALEGAPGRVRVRARVCDVDAADAVRLSPTRPPTPGRFVEITVADDGTGMSPEVAARVFEPFFTTKSDGRGLGLAAVYGIVGSYGGAVGIDTVPGVGTTVRVVLPVLAVPDLIPDVAAPEAATGDRSANALRARDEERAITVLVVEDDDNVREVCDAMLRSAGMQVVGCATGPLGIDHVRADPDRFDALLIDMTMPEMGGEAVLQAVRSVAPHLPAVLMSGFSAVNLHAVLSDLAVHSFVQKPFRSDQLVSAVRGAAMSGRRRRF